MAEEKKQSEEDAFDALRAYLMQAPVPAQKQLQQQHQLALDAALQAIRDARTLFIRDEKLRSKFSTPSAAAPTGAAPVVTAAPEEEDEWQTIADPTPTEVDPAIVQTLAPVQCPTPLHATAAALHVQLLQTYSCTGPTVVSKGGFAPRAGTVWPAGWDAAADSVDLGYRHVKNRNLCRVLHVSCQVREGVQAPGVAVLVKWSKQDESEPLLVWEFPLDRHVNLESWGSGKKQPMLHYKNLAGLLHEFSLRVASVDHDESMRDEAVYRDTSVLQIPLSKESSNNNINDNSNMKMEVDDVVHHLRRQEEQAARSGMMVDPVTGQPHFTLPTHAQRGGDFANDLYPAGLGPHPVGVGGVGGGSLLGPEHALFRGVDGAKGMRPRFDPFGPPGQFHHTPNPDHMQPPNHFNSGGNMFL